MLVHRELCFDSSPGFFSHKGNVAGPGCEITNFLGKVLSVPRLKEQTVYPTLDLLGDAPDTESITGLP